MKLIQSAILASRGTKQTIFVPTKDSQKPGSTIPLELCGKTRSPTNEEGMDAAARKNAIDSLKDLGSVLKDRSASDGAILGVDLGRGGSSVSDDVLVHLRFLPEIRNLYLDQTDVTDKVLEVLQFCPKLLKLNIADTQITDNGLEMLMHGQSLESLTIGFDNPEGAKRITDDGFQNVAYAINLNELALSRTLVTANGLACIRALEKLATLTLSPRQVSPESIAVLASLPSLRIIMLTRGYPLGHPPMKLLEDVEPTAELLRMALPNISVTY